MVHVPVGEQHPVHLVQAAILRVPAIAGPQPRIVGREVVAVEAFERGDQTHAEVVAHAQCRAARLYEFLEELPGGPEAHAEIEQPAPLGPLQQDPVATDLTGGAAIDGNGEAGS